MPPASCACGDCKCPWRVYRPTRETGVNPIKPVACDPPCEVARRVVLTTRLPGPSHTGDSGVQEGPAPSSDEEDEDRAAKRPRWK